MISIKTYVSLFLISLVFLLIGLIFSISIVNTIVSGLFILSTLFLIFTGEEKPKVEEDYSLPEVHLYQRSRVNNSTYMIVGGAGFIAFLFYVSTIYTNVNIGIISLTLWLFMIVMHRVAVEYSGKKLVAEIIADYIKINNNLGISISKLTIIIENLINSKEREKKELKKILNNYLSEITKKEEEIILNDYLRYLKETENLSDTITSEEIRILNDRDSK